MSTTRPRHRNGGIRKACGCPRSKWAKCSHSWHFNYKPKGGPDYRFSLDRELGRRIEGKTEAEQVAEDIRTAIRAGTFRRSADGPPASPAPATTPDAVTFTRFGATYLTRRGKPATGDHQSNMRRLMAFELPGAGPLGEKALGAITEDDIEAFFAHLQAQGRASSTRNKYVTLVKAMFRWAVRKKYLAQNPIADAEAIRREKMAQRSRRLVPDVVSPKTGKLEREGEERRLLAVAGLRLQRLVIAALETGCRRGELLALQWRDIDLQRRELTVRAENAKTREGRVLPISPRLAGILEMAQTALVAALPLGELTEQERAALLADCYVFGDAAGRKIANIKKAWETAVLKAHGIEPTWSGANKLSVVSRAALQKIDLHFHDLRHEAGSRFIEAGWPIHHVSEMLGHASLEQTSTYLNVTRVGLHESMRRFDDAVARCKPIAKSVVIEHRSDCNDDSENAPKTLVQ
jgi:integrase